MRSRLLILSTTSIVFSFFFLPITNGQINCSRAPEIGTRIMCFQILKWDEDVRAAQRLNIKFAVSDASGPDGIYDCMTVDCICSKTSGACPGKSLRKEYRMLTDDERNRYHAAMWRIKRNGDYLPLSRIHATFSMSPGAHSGPAFFPWHREYIKRLEIALRRVDPNIPGLPYWDSTLDRALPTPEDSVLWGNELMGRNDRDLAVRTGAFAGWPIDDGSRIFRRDLGNTSRLISEDDLQGVFAIRTITDFLAFTAAKNGCPNPSSWDAPEFVHGKSHVWTGGDMLLTRMSTFDPLFFLHHSFIDLMWETWREMRQTRASRETEWPRDNAACSTSAHFARSQMTPFAKMNIDGLSNQYMDNLVSYAPRPSCTANTRDCGSRFLFCDLSHGPAHCVSKSRLGGNCRGFVNGEDACYEGQCIGGTCVTPRPRTAMDVAVTAPPTTTVRTRATTVRTTTRRPTTVRTTTRRTTTRRPATTRRIIRIRTTTRPRPTVRVVRPFTPRPRVRGRSFRKKRRKGEKRRRSSSSSDEDSSSSSSSEERKKKKKKKKGKNSKTTTKGHPAESTTEIGTTTIAYAPTLTYSVVTTATTQRGEPTTSTSSYKAVSTTGKQAPYYPMHVPDARTTTDDGICLNSHFCCLGWASLGYCTNAEYISFMEKYCAPSCDKCNNRMSPNSLKSTEVCEDFLPNCQDLAGKGECTANEVYMKENCKKTCRSCDILNFKTRLTQCGLDRGPDFEGLHLRRKVISM